jgi:antitoxin VapB
MRTTKVFKSGNSMAVRLPKGFDLAGDQVEIFKRHGEIVLREIPEKLSAVFDVFDELPDDLFEEGREDDLPQERDEL